MTLNSQRGACLIIYLTTNPKIAPNRLVKMIYLY